MTDWKTTIAGLVAGIVTMLKAVGLEIPQPVSDGIVAIALFFIAFFAKDK